MHHWATQGLNYYILAKLHWNADLNVDEAIDDYCRSGFADAADQIKSYLLRVEQLTNSTAAKKMRDINSRTTDVTEFYTPQVIAELHGFLDAANEAVKDNEEIHRRIAFLELGLDFTELQAEIYRLLRLSGERRLEPAEKIEATRLLDKKFRMMRNIFDQDHYAINVAVMSWGEWGRFKRLGWDGPSTENQAASN